MGALQHAGYSCELAAEQFRRWEMLSALLTSQKIDINVRGRQRKYTRHGSSCWVGTLPLEQKVGEPKTSDGCGCDPTVQQFCRAFVSE